LRQIEMREYARKQCFLVLISLTMILLGPALGIVTGESSALLFSDPKNDLFDKDGKSVTAEPCLDIVSVNIWKSGTDTSIEMTLEEAVPRSIDSSIFIQWSIYIDVDCNPNTGERSSLLYNDLGVDYNIRLTMLDSTFYSQIRTMPERKDMGKPRYSIKDNKITFIVGPQELQLPATPIFMIVTAQKWSNRGQLPDTSLLAADKAPNTGHYMISVGATETGTTTILQTTETRTKAIQLWVVISSDNKYFDFMIETDNFKIYFHTSDKEFASSLIQAAEDAYPVLSRVYGDAPSSKTAAFLFFDIEEAEKLGFRFGAPSPTDPNYSAGEFSIAEPLGDGVRLYFPAKDKVLNVRAKDIVAHEIGHRFLRLIYPKVRTGVSLGTYPRWVNEGFSTYVGTEFSQQFTFLDAVVQEAKRGTIPQLRLDTLDKIEANSSRLYYGLAATVLYYIAANYGEQALKQLLAEWNRGAGFRVGIEQVLQVSYSDFEQAWMNRIGGIAKQAKDGAEFYYSLTGKTPTAATSRSTRLVSETKVITPVMEESSWLQTNWQYIAAMAVVVAIAAAVMRRLRAPSPSSIQPCLIQLGELQHR